MSRIVEKYTIEVDITPKGESTVKIIKHTDKYKGVVVDILFGAEAERFYNIFLKGEQK